MQHNCYNCKYRGGVPGSAHSSCSSAGSSPVVAMHLAVYVEKSNGDFQNLKLNPHGMRNRFSVKL